MRRKKIEKTFIEKIFVIVGIYRATWSKKGKRDVLTWLGFITQITYQIKKILQQKTLVNQTIFDSR